MFRQKITTTALTSPIADNYFSNIINGVDFEGDKTFLSTLRALITPRMNEGETLRLQFGYSRYEKHYTGVFTPKRFFEEWCSVNFTQNNTIYIHNIDGTKEDSVSWLDYIKSNFARVYNGWCRLPKVTDLFRGQFYVLCFVNPELKSVAVFVENLSIVKMHYLQCAILGFFPWYFSPEKGVSNEEMALINTLRAKSANDYLECIAKIAERYDFRIAKIKQQLAGFETQYEQQEYESTKANILNIDTQINRLNQDISYKLQTRRDLEIRLLGLETKITSSSESSEIMDYFIHNKKLDLDYVTNGVLVFTVKDYISYFDEDMAKRTIDNFDSYIYRADSGIPDYKLKELMYSIFIDQKIRIKICAAYSFELTGCVNGRSGYVWSGEYSNYMPNPHIQEYSCMGNYSILINESLANHDYITALEQTIASAKSLNFGDSTVMNSFISNFRSRRKCFELPDGTCVSAAQAADWVWEQNHTDKQEDISDE